MSAPFFAIVFLFWVLLSAVCGLLISIWYYLFALPGAACKDNIYIAFLHKYTQVNNLFHDISYIHDTTCEGISRGRLPPSKEIKPPPTVAIVAASL
jgi:hypothetical protein